ncbi:lipopolysaccharide biosynthesis protein [Gemmatimonadota bacterium]
MRRQIGVLVGGTAVGQLLVIASSPLLARLYKPNDFGLLAGYASILSIIGVVSCFKYELAIPLASDDNDASNILCLSLLGVIITSIMIAAGIGLVGKEVLLILQLSKIAHLVWLLPPGVLILGTYQALNYWAIRQGDYNILGATKIYQGGFLATAQVLLGLLSAGSYGLVFGEIIGRGAGSLKLYRASRQTGFSLINASITSMKRNAIRFKRFPLISGLSAVLNTGGLQMPSLLMLGLYGSGEAGFFFFAQRIIGLPMSLIGKSVAQVYFGQASQVIRTEPNQLIVLFRGLLKRLTIIGLIPAVILVLLAQPIFQFVFGSEWLNSGRFAQLMSPFFFMQFISVPLSQSLNIMELQHIQFWWDLLRLIFVVSAIIGVWFLEMSAVTAVAVYSLTMVVCYAVLLILCYHFINQRSSRETNAELIEN